MDLDAIGIGTNAHLLYVVIGKADVDELITLEAALNILDVLLLAKAGVLNHLVVEVLIVLGSLLGLLDDMTYDDDSVVVEDALDIVGTLKSEGSLVVLEEGGDDHADRVGPASSLAVEYIIACSLVETEGDRLNLLIGIEGKGYILYERAVVVLEGELHRNTAADDTLAKLIEVKAWVTKDSGSAIADETVEHIETTLGEVVANRVVLLCLDGIDDVTDDLCHLGRCILLHSCGMTGNTHVLDSLLELSLSGLHLLLLRTIDDYSGLGERCGVEHLGNHLELAVLAHLSGKLVLVLELELIGRSARVELDLRKTVLG